MNTWQQTSLLGEDEIHNADGRVTDTGGAESPSKLPPAAIVNRHIDSAWRDLVSDMGVLEQEVKARCKAGIDGLTIPEVEGSHEVAIEYFARMTFTALADALAYACFAAEHEARR